MFVAFTVSIFFQKLLNLKSLWKNKCNASKIFRLPCVLRYAVRYFHLGVMRNEVRVALF